MFLSDLEDFFELMSTRLLRHREATNRVAPVRELFAHVAQMPHLRAALIAADKRRDFMEMGQEYFARAIDRRLGELTSSRTIATAQRKAMAHALAGALLSLMSWWIGQGTSASPEEMDYLYHQMVWSGVNARPASSGPMPVT